MSQHVLYSRRESSANTSEMLAKTRAALEQVKTLGNDCAAQLHSALLSDESDIQTTRRCEALDRTVHLAMQTEVALVRISALLTVLSIEEKAANAVGIERNGGECIPLFLQPSIYSDVRI